MCVENYRNLTLDGGVKKLVKQQGDGVQPQANQRVWINYTASLENGEVFDSTREREKPLSFRLGKRSVILGLEILVATMKVGEVCSAILAPEYAFGSEGRLKHYGGTSKHNKKDRDKRQYAVPPNATVYFNVELVDVAPTVPEKSIQSLSPSDKLRRAAELKDKGNSYYKELKFNLARESYEEATRILDYLWQPNANANHESENGHKEVEDGDIDAINGELNSLRVAILSNIALTYFKEDRFSQAEQYASSTLKLDRNNVKALFCRGRARMKLGDFQGAKEDLMQAAKLQPQNKDIRNELEELQKRMVKYGKQEKATYRAMFE
eukprot:jgi/Galph1/628/GphlegSOOS_G5428.1